MAEIRIVISGDSSGAEAALAGVDAGLNKFAGRADPTKKVDQTIQGVTRSTRQAAEQMRNLNYQVTDIVTGLATGQNPFYVLLQQGGQLKDVFGGVGPALKAVAGLFTVVRVAVGGTVGALAAFVYGAYAGSKEAKELDQVLRLSGDAALGTAGKFRVLTSTVADDTRTAIGNVRELGLALLKTGDYGGTAFEPVVKAAALYQKITGANAEDTSKVFSGMTRDVAAWATSANRSYHFVTQAQVDQIRSLQANGDVIGATTLAATLFAENLETKVRPNLGYLDKALESTSLAWSKFWAAVKNVGADETPEDRIKRLTDSLAGFDKNQNRPLAFGETQKQRDRANAAADAARAELSGMKTLQAASVRAMADRAGMEAEEQRKIDSDSDANAGARASKDKAAIALRLATQQAGLEAGRRIIDAAFQRDEVEAQDYQGILLQIELAGIASREAAVRASAAADGSRKPSTPAEIQQRAAAQLDAERQLLDLANERAKLLDAEKNGQRDVTPKDRSNSTTDALRRFDAAQRAQEQAGLDARRVAALNAATEMVALNKQMGIDLIQDDYVRAQVQLASDLELARKRLDIAALSDQDRKDAEDAFAEYRLLKQRKLTEDLKPVWQQQVEAWQDVTRLMREANDEGLNGLLKDSEDAFAQLVTTGKLSLNTLLRDFLLVQARLAFRKAVGSVANLLVSAFGGGSGATGVAAEGGYASVAGISGGRAGGGGVNPRSLQPVNEKGMELLSVGGRDYLMTGSQGGRVTPNNKLGGGKAVVINQQIVNNIDSRSDAATITQIVAASVEQGRQRTFEELRAARVI